MEGEHVTPDHHAIITADGHMIPNDAEVVMGED
jgi:hypothetical protein